jgi:peptidoglycan/LPS O-acetylase OafA/YrhL
VTYRADIDGFRSIAVLLVIFFHFELGSLSGGFIGVDIFFVLSGYLISSIVFEQLKTGSFSFSGFYFRRIRRLFPVYVVVMLATFAVAYWIMLPQDFREFGKTLIASTLYISNILFYLGSGYFDTGAHLKPLLHTWSLSVEEQFYFVFPFVAWLLVKIQTRYLFQVFLALTIASFIAATYYIKLDENAVFFLYPFRAWEMFLGTLIALKPLPISRSSTLRHFSAGAGLICIAVPAVYYDSSTLFPGLAALAPCLGAMLIIDSARTHSTWLSVLLSTRPFVYIGKISYSLYLWHWPIFVLFSYIKPQGITVNDSMIMLVVTFAASAVSYALVEKPIRSGQIALFKKALPTYATTFALTFILAGLGFLVYKKDGMDERFSPEIATLAKATSDFLKDTLHCTEGGNDQVPDLDFCEYGDPLNASQYVLIWGDSHSGAMMPSFKKAFENRGIDALQIWFAGCPPLFGIEKDESVSSTLVDQECGARNRKTQQFIRDNQHKISAVLMVGRWSYYINGGGIGYDAHNTISLWHTGDETSQQESTQTVFLSALDQTFEWFTELEKSVFFVEQPPEISNFKGRSLAIELATGQSSFEDAVNTFAVEPIDSVENRQGALDDYLTQAKQSKRLVVLPTHQFFCDKVSCSAFIDDYPVFADNNHLSAEGARKISQIYAPLIKYISSEEEE